MPVKSPIPDIDIPDVDIVTFFFDKAQARADALAAAGVSELPLVIDAVSGRSLCFSDIKRNTMAIARGISALIPKNPAIKNGSDEQGIRIDRAVLVLLLNDVIYSAIHFGILMAGCTHVALDPKLSAQELATKLMEIGLTSAVAAFVDAEAIGELEAAAKIAGVELQKQAIFTMGSEERLALDTLVQENIDKPYMPYEFTPEELATLPALLMYSSGTAGQAKSIVLTRRNILAANIMVGGYSARTAAVAQNPSHTSQGRILSALPPSHVYGHFVLSYQPLTHGDCVVLLRRFAASSFLEAIERHKITRISATPHILKTLLHETTKIDVRTARMCDNPGTKFYVGSVIAIGCGGASLPPMLMQKYSEYFGGAPMFVGYGQTESSSIIAGNSWDVQATPGAIGVLYPNTVAKVVDAEGNETDKLGELCISGPHVMKGYAGNVKSPIVDGFLHTGDYARLSADGDVFLHGRLEDVVHTVQGQIVPTDVEAMLADNPAIVDSAVVGVGKKGEAQAVVFLVLAKSDVPKNELLSDVRQFVITQMGNPHVVCREVSNIPKTPAGKILRHCLLEQLYQ